MSCFWANVTSCRKMRHLLKSLIKESAQFRAYGAWVLAPTRFSSNCTLASSAKSVFPMCRRAFRRLWMVASACWGSSQADEWLVGVWERVRESEREELCPVIRVSTVYPTLFYYLSLLYYQPPFRKIVCLCYFYLCALLLLYEIRCNLFWFSVQDLFTHVFVHWTKFWNAMIRSSSRCFIR